MRKWMVAGLLILLPAAAAAQVHSKCEASIEGFRIHNVYIAGSQYSGVAWAYKHLAEATCMTPVTDLGKADAILEVTPALTERQSDSGAFSVTCTSGKGISSCLDSDGNAMTVDCAAGVCNSYYGPSVGSAILKGLSDWVRRAWYQSNAHLYTRDHKILWKSENQKGQHFYDLWPDLLREATFASPCHVPASKSGDRYRKYASDRCGVQFDPLVSIDLKIRAKNEAAARAQAEKDEMLKNARDAARQQKQ